MNHLNNTPATSLAWWKAATAYQIYPRSFFDSNQDGIGDIAGIITKLDYLAELGIDLVWICPFYQSLHAADTMIHGLKRFAWFQPLNPHVLLKMFP